MKPPRWSVASGTSSFELNHSAQGSGAVGRMHAVASCMEPRALCVGLGRRKNVLDEILSARETPHSTISRGPSSVRYALEAEHAALHGRETGGSLSEMKPTCLRGTLVPLHALSQVREVGTFLNSLGQGCVFI